MLICYKNTNINWKVQKKIKKLHENLKNFHFVLKKWH